MTITNWLGLQVVLASPDGTQTIVLELAPPSCREPQTLRIHAPGWSIHTTLPDFERLSKGLASALGPPRFHVTGARED